MNNKHQENEALTGPLIFTIPAPGFVVALNLDWLDTINRKEFQSTAIGVPDVAGDCASW
jgi:hypothetical protein